MSDKLRGRLSNESQSLRGRVSNQTEQLIGRISTRGGVITDHRLLEYRDASDQHPIESITNLEPELNWRPSTALSNSDIQSILER